MNKRNERNIKLILDNIEIITESGCWNGFTQEELADKYSISRRQIRDIISRVAWKHIK